MVDYARFVGASIVLYCIVLYCNEGSSSGDSRDAWFNGSNVWSDGVCYKKYCYLNTANIFTFWRFGLYQRPSSEEVSSIPLPVLATIVMRRGKKSVVRVAQRVAPLVPVQGLPSLFSNMHCLFDPPSTFVGFSVQNSGGRPIDHVVFMMVCVAGRICCSDIIISRRRSKRLRQTSNVWTSTRLSWQARRLWTVTL